MGSAVGTPKRYPSRISKHLSDVSGGAWSEDRTAGNHKGQAGFAAPRQDV